MEPWVGNSTCSTTNNLNTAFPTTSADREQGLDKNFDIDNDENFWTMPWIPSEQYSEEYSRKLNAPAIQEPCNEADGKGIFKPDDNHLRMLERKLKKVKEPSQRDGKSMLAFLKLAKEDFMMNFINESDQNCYHSEDMPVDQTFFDKLYSTNVVYRHLFPENHALGTMEKQPLLERNKIAEIEKEINEDSSI